MTFPTDKDFANEVKADRLTIISRITLGFCVVAVIILLTFGSIWRISAESGGGIIGALLLLIAGSTLTMGFIKREQLSVAIWVYTVGWFAGIGLMLSVTDETGLQLLPFVFPVVIFIIGLMISPMETALASLLAIAIILVAPGFMDGAWITLDIHQAFAIILILMSTLMAAQVTGELYQIAQWALQNYQRERRTNDELFAKRQELQLSLKRSEALSDKLRDANDELKQAHKAAEDAKNFRGQFLANMSHELRTPLNAIIGFSETMLKFPIMYDDENLPVPYERDLSQIYSSGRQLLHVINDILDLARVDAGKLEVHLQSVDARPVINAVISTAKGLLGSKPVKLDTKMPEDIPALWADESRLRQVLLNLYSNACKYTHEGAITLHVHQTGTEVEFAVSDTGEGIPAQYHEQLFEEFKQAGNTGRDPRSGSGLGLAIARQLVTLMGGRIWMESQVGVGSTFTFTIPAHTDQAEPRTEPMRPAALNEALAEAGIKTAPVMTSADHAGTTTADHAGTTTADHAGTTTAQDPAIAQAEG